MAISFVGAATPDVANNGGNSVIDLTTITNLAEGDVVIVAYCEAGATDTAMSVTEAGWTANEIAELYSNSTQDTNLAAYWKRMGSTLDTTVTCVGSGTGVDSTAAVAMAFRGVDPDTPLDVARTVNQGTGTTDADPPAIDWTTAGTWVVIVGGGGHTTGAGATYAAPSGYTTNFTTVSGNDNNDALIGMGYNPSPSDPENPGIMDGSPANAANLSWAAITIALRAKAAATLTGQALLEATANIEAGGAVQHERETSLAATADLQIAASVTHVFAGAASLEATADIAGEGTLTHVLLGAVTLDATADIVAAGTFETPSAYPYQVQNLVATAVSTSEIDLTWDDVAALTGEAFDIERNGVVVLEDYTGPHAVGDPYPDTGLDPDTEYTYRVRAVGGVA